MPGSDSHYLMYTVSLNYQTGRWEVKHAAGHVVADTRLRNDALQIRRMFRIHIDVTDTLRKGSSDPPTE